MATDPRTKIRFSRSRDGVTRLPGLFRMSLIGWASQGVSAFEGMLCGLAAGLDAVRAVGVDERRIMLIGGAAQNIAVTTIAAQVFEASSLSLGPASTSPMARPCRPLGL
jgi:hypothetical protein